MTPRAKRYFRRKKQYSLRLMLERYVDQQEELEKFYGEFPHMRPSNYISDWGLTLPEFSKYKLIP